MELIKDDKLDKANSYLVETDIEKMCWGCETKHTSGYMVQNTNKMRRIFLCEECKKGLN